MNMEQEKLKRVVTAAAVAGTLVIAILFFIIVYQLIRIGVLEKRENDLKSDIAKQERLLDEGGEYLEKVQEDWWLEQEAYRNNFIYPGDK